MVFHASGHVLQAARFQNNQGIRGGRLHHPTGRVPSAVRSDRVLPDREAYGARRGGIAPIINVRWEQRFMKWDSFLCRRFGAIVLSLAAFTGSARAGDLVLNLNTVINGS